MPPTIARRTLLHGGLAASLGLALPAARACEFWSTHLRIYLPRCRATAPGETVAALCMTFDQVLAADRLIGVDTPVAAGAEMGGADERPVVDFAYPGGAALLASNSLETPVIGLVGRADDGRFDRTRLRERLAAAAWSPDPASFGIEDEFALLGSFVGGPSALNRFAGHAPANTDDHPVVAYAAPLATYAPASPPRDRLLALIKELGVGPDEVVDAANDRDVGARLAAYRTARDRFLAAGRDVRRVAGAAEMLAQVRDPLLAIVRISPDFRPAYDPLRRLAIALMRTDPVAAQALLGALARARRPGQDAARGAD